MFTGSWTSVSPGADSQKVQQGSGDRAQNKNETRPARLEKGKEKWEIMLAYMFELSY